MRRQARVFGLIGVCFIGASVASASTTSQRASLPFEEFAPTWSPDGKQIAYVRGQRANIYDGFHSARIAVATSNGSHRRLVTGTDAWSFDPAWSPNGRKLAYVRVLKISYAQGRLYAISPSRPKPMSLARGEGQYTRLSWSPDGHKLAFAIGGNGIWVASMSGGKLEGIWRQVVPSGRDPSWSPDGTRIAFAEGPNISTIEPDGSNRQVVVQRPLVCFDPGGCSFSRDPAWSPDSKRIAFVTIYAPESTIAIVDAGGGEPRVIHTGKGRLQDLAWSPNGSRIAFARQGSGIYLMSPDGTHVRRLRTALR